MHSTVAQKIVLATCVVLIFVVATSDASSTSGATSAGTAKGTAGGTAVTAPVTTVKSGSTQVLPSLLAMVIASIAYLLR